MSAQTYIDNDSANYGDSQQHQSKEHDTESENTTNAKTNAKASVNDRENDIIIKGIKGYTRQPITITRTAARPII